MKANRFLPSVIFVFVAAGCSASSHGSVPSFSQSVIPQVKQGGPKPITWIQFPSTVNNQGGIVVGSDRDMWFPAPTVGGIARMDMTGKVTTFPLSCFGQYLAVGSDGNFYSPSTCTQGPEIVQVTPSGVEQDFPIPSGDSVFGNGVALGPDGNVWFMEGSHIGRITPTGQISEFRLPTGVGLTNSGVTGGFYGKIWFTESAAHLVGSIDPSSDVLTEYNIPSPPGGSRCDPDTIVSAGDGNLYFDCLVGALGQMSPATPGQVNYILQPWGFKRNVQDVAVGPDQGIWFVSGTGAIIGEYNYKSQTVTGYIPPQSFAGPLSMIAGPDENVWTSAGQNVDVYVLKVLTVNPKTLRFTGIGQQLSFRVTETGTSHWSAQSSNLAVATVAQGGNQRTFVVTAVGSGKCVITVSDTIGNLINVKVTVP